MNVRYFCTVHIATSTVQISDIDTALMVSSLLTCVTGCKPWILYPNSRGLTTQNPFAEDGGRGTPPLAMLASDSQGPGFGAGFGQAFGAAAAPLRRVVTESEILSALGALSAALSPACGGAIVAWPVLWDCNPLQHSVVE